MKSRDLTVLSEDTALLVSTETEHRSLLCAMLPPQLVTLLDASVLLESSGSTRELKPLMNAPLAGLDTTVKVCLAPTPRKNVKQVSYA